MITTHQPATRHPLAQQTPVGIPQPTTHKGNPTGFRIPQSPCACCF